MKSSESGETAIYLRTLIPDKYDENLADTYALSCESRGGFSGIEYFSTLNGMPVSIAKFDNGKIVDNVFMGDTNLSETERMEKLSTILKNIVICRCDNGTRVKEGEWEYGKPGETFIDQNGSSYIYVDTDGDGKADAITQNFDFMSNTIFQSGNGSSGSGSGSSSGGSGGSGTIGSANNFGNGGTFEGIGRESPGLGDAGTSLGGVIGGGGTGGNNNGGSGSSSSEGDNILSNKKWDPTELRKLGIDPLGFSSIDNDILKSPQKPKYDYKNSKSDPLVNMEILGSIKHGIKGGRFGKGRGRMHNGCDLKADIGTPVYAMFSGKVSRTVSKYDGNIPFEKYSSIYSGIESDNAAGNRVWLDCTLKDGSQIRIKYFHLDEVSVTAKDNLLAGNLIGTVGITGSANSAACAGPHLHLEVWLYNTDTKTFVLVDPEQYFFTQFNEFGTSIK